MSEARDFAYMLNVTMKPGQEYVLDYHELQQWQGSLWDGPLEVIKENLIGSAVGCWDIREDLETGHIRFRKIE